MYNQVEERASHSLIDSIKIPKSPFKRLFKKPSPTAKKMQNIEITFTTLLAFFGAIAVVGGGVKIIVSALNPFKEVKAKVKEHEDRFKKETNRLEELDESLDRIEKEQKVQGKALMVLINHLVTGNDVDKLKKVYQDMVNHYIEL